MAEGIPGGQAPPPEAPRPHSRSHTPELGWKQPWARGSSPPPGLAPPPHSSPRGPTLPTWANLVMQRGR